ncbi:hypothetical protein DTO027B5_1712 [Paecilomyces variotii]|nr:hypothetical protein DTO027B3_1254 [Paecilomyces variotii]KAJ9336397.1 hypothetical protein DTO027B5_1712 [Paecilomyces variotii]
MSLRVQDPRIRSRSKSPSGRSVRERSRSRDSRAPSPAPGKDARRSYQYDSDEETPRYVSGQQKVRSNGRSDVEREKSRQTERERYYHSDSDGDSGHRGSNGRSGRSRYDPDSDDGDRNYYLSHGNRPSSRYESYDDASLLDSDDEALVYGDVPASIAGKNYKLPSAPQPPSRDDYLNTTRRDHDRPSRSSSRVRSRANSHASDQAPGVHPSYARPERWSYAQPTQYSHTQPASLSDQRHPSYSNSQAPTLPADWAPIPECELPGFVPPVSHAHSQSIPGGFPSTLSSPSIYVQPDPKFPSHGASPPVSPRPQYANLPPQQYVQGPSTATTVPPADTHHTTSVPQLRYANPGQFQYAQPDPNIKYASKSNKVSYTQSDSNQFVKPYTQSADPQFVEIKPGGGRADTSSQRHRPHSLSVSSANNLSVAGAPTGRPPASPLLEAYKGTYQSISPMPSPIMMAPRLDDDFSDIEALDGTTDSERRKKHKRKTSRDDRHDKDKKKEKEREKEREIKEKEKEKDRKRRHERHNSSNEDVILISPTSTRKKVSFYDPTEHALALREALAHRNIDSKPLLDILPHLTSDEILLLRAEYKNHAKLHGKGINIAKHIKLKLGNSTFGKVCYATALGRWESEAHWANYYYQAGTSRRELLIESLIGRTNSEIREIKTCFRDSRYGNSLEKCMHAELKADKFRTAILLALEERRQSDHEPLDRRLVERDVQELRRAVISREGGETAMIYIIVLRSDNHLREVLRIYDAHYQQNFTRALIAKSQNLVGETLAHILNGAMNRPMRDALLLHQAISESRSGRERSELLISRLVRLHWEPRHLERVKHEYRKRYGQRLEESIAEEVGSSDWGEFCIELANSSTDLTVRS